jgi:hypothetical protein
MHKIQNNYHTNKHKNAESIYLGEKKGRECETQIITKFNVL